MTGLIVAFRKSHRRAIASMVEAVNSSKRVARQDDEILFKASMVELESASSIWQSIYRLDRPSEKEVWNGRSIKTSDIA